MGENLLTVVLVRIETIAWVERLTVNRRDLDLSIEKVLDPRRSPARSKWRRYGIQILDEVDKELGAAENHLGDILYRFLDGLSTVVVVIQDDHRLCWSRPREIRTNQSNHKQSNRGTGRCAQCRSQSSVDELSRSDGPIPPVQFL